MTKTSVLICIVATSLITYFYRAFPFIFFSRFEVPKWFNKLQDKLPPAFMIILVVYCLKGCVGASLIENIYTLLAVLVTIVVHLLKKNTIISIICGTFIYMLLMNVFMPI